MVKIRALQAELKQLGFSPRPASRHLEIWTDPQRPRRKVALDTTGSVAATSFQVAKVRRFRRGTMIYQW
jgi:hypothetical protein